MLCLARQLGAGVELLRVPTLVQEVVRNGSQQVDDATKLVVLGMPREQGETQEEFRDDASETPHVDRGREGHEAQNHVHGAIKSRLDVCVDLLALEGRRSKVDQLDLGVALRREQNVLRLEVAVNNVGQFQTHQLARELVDNGLHHRERQPAKIVVLDHVVQVH